MKLTIDRATWRRGRGSGHSALLRSEGLCCLGFYGRACGIPDHALAGRGMPRFVVEYLKNWPVWLLSPGDVERGMSSDVARQLAAINDDAKITDVVREERIMTLFAANGVTVEFVG